VSQRKRPWIEKAFGLMKQAGGMRQKPSSAGVAWQFLMAAAFNLWRLPKMRSVAGTRKAAFSTRKGGHSPLRFAFDCPNPLIGTILRSSSKGYFNKLLDLIRAVRVG